MIADISHFLLFLALAASVLQTLLPLMGYWQRQGNLMQWASPMQLINTALVIVAFGGLMQAFATSDFSLALVAQHSHSAKPMLYKISGTWGNHEGSLLLWIVVLGLYGATFVRCKNPAVEKSLVLMVHGSISAAFLGFALLTSNPFAKLAYPVEEGLGLNPVLQDIGLALHPPMLYLGYVGLAMAFAVAVAGLLQGRIDQEWARRIRPWVLVAWCCLTAGIVLGSWWAYYELGWGGWWFWDPVENASLMPWLVTTALLHSVIMVEKRSCGQNWAVLLAILGFSLSLIGTFIVRSGLLTSVHSFASDPSRGVYILGILVLAIGLPLILYMINGPKIQTKVAVNLRSREAALIINNFLLLSATAVVLLGTFYPLGLEMINGAKISVGPPFFDSTVLPIMAFGVIGMVFGSALAWRRGWRGAALRILLVALVAVLAAISVGIGLGYRDVAPLASLGLVVWLLVGIFADVYSRLMPWKTGKWKAQCLPQLGMWLGHLGIALLMIGALGEALGQTETIVRARPGDDIALGTERVHFAKIATLKVENYVSLQATLQLSDAIGQEIAVLIPERRHYPAERQYTTEAAIRSSIFGDHYAVLGYGDPEQGFTLRLYHKPLLPWLWIGGAVMVLGGFVSLFMRRRRQG